MRSKKKNLLDFLNELNIHSHTYYLSHPNETIQHQLIYLYIKKLLSNKKKVEIKVIAIWLVAKLANPNSSQLKLCSQSTVEEFFILLGTLITGTKRHLSVGAL